MHAAQHHKSEKSQTMPSPNNPSFFPDQDSPVQPNLQFAQFAAGCFWGVEFAFQHVHGVVKTEVGYTQGHLPEPTYPLVCKDDTGHAEAVRIHYDPLVCKYGDLLQIFWQSHDPTTPNRQGKDIGTQYRSGIYYYSEGQEKEAKESLEKKQKELNGKKIVTEILPARRFYRAEEYYQQYYEKGGVKGCTNPIVCNKPVQCAT